MINILQVIGAAGGRRKAVINTAVSAKHRVHQVTAIGHHDIAVEIKRHHMAAGIPNHVVGMFRSITNIGWKNIRTSADHI